jgi:hypothetical protein
MPRDRMARLVDEIGDVVDWLTFLPGAMVLVSERSAHELSKALSAKHPDLLFVINEIDPHKTDGLLPKPIWNFINHPNDPDKRKLHPALAS